MRHFDYLNAKNEDSIFFQKPVRFSKDSEKELLAQGLGATLYMPGTRPNISGEITAKKYDGLVSMALCLEDAIGDHEVEVAEMNIITHLQQLYMNIEKGLFKYEDLPLIFIRVRNEEQMRNVAGHLGSSIKVLSGFIFPKFNPENGQGYIQGLLDINEAYGLQLYGMPILESEDIIYKETRISSLMKIKELLDQNYGRILNVRMGATDFCGLYGIRRGSDTTIYDISVVRDCIADIVNVFARSEKEYVVSGPVWEYFLTTERVMKPQLRQTPFRNSRGTEGLMIRENILNHYLDGLIKEVLLDKTNGLTGKTIIHPTHILPVHSFSVVSFEEYLDAMSIMESAAGNSGVKKSQFSNKMNEMKPHFNWANKILTKARAYGVYHEQSSYIDLLAKQESIHI